MVAYIIMIINFFLKKVIIIFIRIELFKKNNKIVWQSICRIYNAICKYFVSKKTCEILIKTNKNQKKIIHNFYRMILTLHHVQHENFLNLNRSIPPLALALALQYPELNDFWLVQWYFDKLSFHLKTYNPRIEASFNIMQIMKLLFFRVLLYSFKWYSDYSSYFFFQSINYYYILKLLFQNQKFHISSWCS